MGGPEGEVVAQQGHRGFHPYMSLTIVGEDRQKKDGVGMEVQSLKVVVAEDREEELRKRRHQTGDDGAHEERIEGAPSAFRESRAGLEHRRPVDACAAAIWRTRARLASDMFGGSKADEYQAPAGAWRGAMSS